MALTQAQLLTEINSALGNRDDYPSDRQIVALNMAQMRVARAFDWHEMQQYIDFTLPYTGTDTDRFYTVPSNLRKIYSFRIVDPVDVSKARRLRFVPQFQWDDGIPDSRDYERDTPEIYTIWGTQFEFFRIPDQAYNTELRVAKWPTDFTEAATTQTSDLLNKDDMIICLSVSWAFLTLREEDSANYWFGIYKDMLVDATNENVEEHELELKPRFENARGGVVTVDPWRDPFNRSGRF